MTTFFQISGIVFWLLLIAIFVDLMYTRHYKWLNGYHALTGKKFVRAPVTLIEQRNNDLDSDRINGVET